MRTALLIGLFSAGLSQVSSGAIAHSSLVEIHNGFVVLTASVNGESGNYILDTGAPGLVFNTKYFTDSRASRNDIMHGIHGTIDVSTTKAWNLQWNGFDASGEQGYAIDLSYLERAVKAKVDGLIGMDVFNGYYVVIDYARSTLQLWTSLPDVLKRTAYVQFNLDMQGHVPVIELTHNHQALRFAFDSGSATHIIDNSRVSKFGKDVTFIDPVEIIGADQKVVRASKIEASGLSSNGLGLPPTTFIATDLSAIHANSEDPLDGILGYPFFENRVVVIDKDRRYLRLSQRILPEQIPAEALIALDVVLRG